MKLQFIVHFFLAILQTLISITLNWFFVVASCKMILSSEKCLIFFTSEFFGWAGSLFTLISPLLFWISGNCLSGVFLVLLQVTSTIFFVIKLVVFKLVVPAYIMSSIALALEEQEILFRSFSVLNWFVFLDGKDEQITFS